MRKALVRALLEDSSREFCVMTGDLGYHLLEPLRDALGGRFINFGISEQGMISAAAGIARTGIPVFVYSIAPFLYARGCESVRLDIALQNLPVILLGAGGGYAYGIQGPTHHALEDMGIMGTLQNLRCYAPCFGTDLAELIKRRGPTYIRLVNHIEIGGFAPPPYADFRELLPGGKGVCFALGDMASALYPMLSSLPEPGRPALCACSTIPALREAMPEGVWHHLEAGEPVFVVEEHVRSGGLGASVAQMILEQGCPVRRFEHRFACGYPSGLYGDRNFHQKESGMDPDSIRNLIAGQGEI